MLYIFHVDTGRMLTFDMNLALESVKYLKETIERHHKLPASKQVLLVSGGEMLQTNARVCSYSAGTDTNPIYMFSTTDSTNPPQPWPSIELDTDLKEQVDRSLALPATYNTVVQRAQLAQQIYEMAKEETRVCEKLVHEQHLQQQGWAAVVANMEDITDEFKDRCLDFYRCFDSHLERREQFIEFAKNFKSDLDKLSNVPILTGLMHNAEKPFHGFDKFFNDSESFTKSDESTVELPQSELTTTTVTTQNPNNSSDSLKTALSLLQWISAAENQKSLNHIAQNCSRGLELFDEKSMKNQKAEAQKAIDAAQQDTIKKIVGLEDRLCGLEQLMFDARKTVQEQSEMAQSFQQNQNRANNLGDVSILPDLCASHRSQLVVMLKNHKKLRDIRRRVTRAKDELAINLNQRLLYITQIENRMFELDNKFLFYHRCLRRLQTHLGIIEQIHQAPSMYVNAVTEVVRRRLFSNAFLLWASDLACKLLKITNDEVMRRQEFSNNFEGHFLTSLFPGMDDMPPSYGTIAPTIFDSSLPPLTKEDIQALSSHLPEITSKIQLPDLTAVIEFFSTNLKIQEPNSTINLKPIDIHSHLKEYERGFESETDTEEFETVGQSPIDRRNGINSSIQTSIHIETCTASTSTETIETNSIETITEVRKLKKISKIFQEHNNPPIKPPRSNKSLIELPKIPEIFSPLKNLDFLSSSETSPEIGHQLIEGIENTMADCEFINSEFYIDESLPSSLENEKNLNKMMTTGYSVDLEAIQPIRMNDKTETETVIILLQDNLGTTRIEVERLKAILKSMKKLTFESLELLKNQLKNIKSDSVTTNCDLKQQIDKLNETWIEIENENKIREREMINRLTVDHELELNDIKKCICSKDDEIEILTKNLKNCEESHLEVLNRIEKDKMDLELNFRELNEKLKNYENEINLKNTEKEKALNDVREKLIQEHKTEIESLRCRFKLMTSSMERSPSDTSLEKIERPEYIDLVIGGNLDSFLIQSKEDIAMERGLAIKSAADRERARWGDAFGRSSYLSSSPKSPSSANQDFLKRILDEKDKQLEQFRERESMLNKDNIKLKETIHSLTDSDINESQFSMFKGQFESLQRDKQRLQSELDLEKSKRLEMEKSVIAVKSSSSPISKLTSSQSQNLLKNSIPLESCTTDDVVLVVWNSTHKQYTIVQDSKILYFLHGDSYSGLNLSAPAEGCSFPTVNYCIGRMVEKEYCHARKAENRYNVAIGTKFYRVKVRPKSPSREAKKRSRSDRSDGTGSEPISRSTSTEQCNQLQQNIQHHLIDSFAQTDILDPVIEDPSASRDMIDSGVETQQKTIYKERTVSISVEDEPIHLSDEQHRRHYVSVSEEDENISRDDEADQCQKSIAATFLDTSHSSDEFRSLETIE